MKIIWAHLNLIYPDAQSWKQITAVLGVYIHAEIKEPNEDTTENIKKYLLTELPTIVKSLKNQSYFDFQNTFFS